jgi:membrane-associated phospholipid phosphatase
VTCRFTETDHAQKRVSECVVGYFPEMRSHGIGGIVRDVRWLLIPAVCLVALMVALGYLLTEVLPSTAIGKWDAAVPSRLVEYRQQEGVSESEIITMLSATPTIIALTVLAAAVFRWKLGRWRESLLVIYAVVGETSIFVATTLFIDRPRPNVPHLDAAPPTSSFPSGHTAAAVCFYGSVAAIILWHSRHRWIKVVAVVVCAAVPLMIAGARVYRGMHYPTDVIVGVLLGAIWLTVVIFYVRTHAVGGRRHAAVDADRRLVSG